MVKDGPYAGIDLAFTMKLSAAFWALGLMLFAACLPFYPPTHVFGAFGWVLVGVNIGIAALLAIRLRLHPEKVTMNALMLQTCLSVAQLGTTEWLAGGGSAPYGQLLGFSLFGVALAHPPRRAAPFGVYVTVVAFLPLAYGPHGFPAAVAAVSLVVALSISALVAATMENTRRQRARLASEGDAARSDSMTDSLTGLGNRRAFDLALEAAVRTGGAVLALIDVDDFKRVNDTFGHEIGDRYLIACASAVLESVRLPDSSYRWGGDEFAVLLADGANERTAEAVLGRIRHRVGANFHLPDGTTPTFTLGSASCDPPATPAQVLAAADEAMMARKRAHKAADRPDPLRVLSAR
jgi:diguanylate cyclase (GGDEF)-like protein